MIFTTKAEYGVRLLVELGRARADGGVGGPGSPVSLKAIAERDNLPLAYLERIVALLRRAGLVESTRGAHGGYRLARDPQTLSMDEVIIALEGVVAPMECFVDDQVGDGRVLCSHEADRGHGCATKRLGTRVHGSVMHALGSTTLAELVAFSAREQAPVAIASTQPE
jgi:Rrf2 family transcriptional regulator, cysteine metabolism repressor